MTDLSLVPWSLERVAERHGDPTQAVYDALFKAAPDTRGLFDLDPQGAARGNMLANVFEVIFDLSGPRAYGLHMVRAEVFNHESLGVSPSVFGSLFPIIRDVIRELIDEDWTAQVDAAWAEMLADLRRASNPAEALD